MKLIIFADDLTGALDTGVQCVKKGDKAAIYTTADNIDWQSEADVLVINTDTRHVSAEEAYQKLADLTKQAQSAHAMLYKKTDSALRGNIGAELAAVLDHSDETKLIFVPAYPKMERLTVNGIHYISGIEVSESVFGRDVLNPVKTGNVEDLIHTQSNVKVVHNNLKDDSEEKEIIVMDCDSRDRMQEIVKDITTEGISLVAGCAGMFECFGKMGTQDRKETLPKLSEKLLVLSGSMNDITASQLAYAQAHGALHKHLAKVTSEEVSQGDAFVEKTAEEFFKQCQDQEIVILDSVPEQPSELGCTGQEMARIMGKLAKVLSEKMPERTLMIIGGDTLLAFIEEMNVQELRPIAEPEPGAVLAEYDMGDQRNYVITKSGGFGTEDLLERIKDKTALKCEER